MNPTRLMLLPSLHRPSGFALISVLALVSLAALTATAFLASSRLEKQATRSIGETTRLAMTLNAGRECATEVLNNVAEPGYGWNFVTTYWRDNATNELGYLFVGGANSKNNLRWTYLCGFTPATWKSLDTNVVRSFISATNTVCQASFSNDLATFMRTATNGFVPQPMATNRLCTVIPMVGGRTSPPVGWVYINQEIRTNPASTNTASLPAARFAYFIEDLGGLIDAERMGAITNRPSGTNPEEISLSNLPTVSITNLSDYSKKRGQYITPGMLLSANGGVLGSNSALSYFASRLRYCYWSNGTDWDRIPTIPISSTVPFYPTNAGFLKRNLNTNLTAAKLDNIVSTITNNFRNFTNRAGGMNGTNYVYALAANMVDYADADSLPTAYGTIVGWDAYPLPTQIFDQMVWNKAAQTLSVTTYIQLWNQSTRTSPATSYTFINNFQDTYSDGTTRILPAAWTTNFSVPKLNPNQGVVLSVGMPLITGLNTALIGTSGNFPINGTDKLVFNAYSFVLNGAPIAKINTPYERKAKTLQDGIPEWSGCLPALRYDLLPTKVLTTGDPRMLNYITHATIPASAVNYQNNSVWASYGQTRNASGTPPNNMFADRWNADPRNWPDGISSTTYPVTGQQPANVNTPPTTGLFSPPGVSGVAFCKLSPTNTYTNITELGNVFDPIQWAPSSTNTVRQQSDYVNCDIAAGTTWTANSMYGGGQTLRIGRPEHSRFAFTNLDSSKTSYPVPSLGTSAAGLMDLFCVTNAYNWAGKININTAPLPVLAALAGGITLSKDPDIKGNAVNSQMVSAFTNGVARFRSTYPFISPSQLAFISANYGLTGWTNSSVWTQNAVFGTNTFGGLKGVTSLNDEGREEWFAKIYNLTTVQSFNYRIYVVAQLVDTNGNPKGSVMRKYYQVYLRNNTPQGTGDTAAPSVSPTVTYEAFY